MEAQEWLEKENREQHDARLERLCWLASLKPQVDWMVYGTGLISKYLFDEAQYSFAYGQYLGSIILGLAFLEMCLAGAFYAAGRDDLERAGIAKLSKEALKHGWLSQLDFEALDQVRDYRNPVTHFRPPGHQDRIEARVYYEGSPAYEIIERDARIVMQTVFKLLLKVVPWSAREIPK